jgi:hypothetical protein
VANSFKKKENLDKKYFLGEDDLLYENYPAETELHSQKSTNNSQPYESSKPVMVK